MATISSAGIGSGLDVESIVNALVNVERVPITNLAKQAETLQTKLSRFGTLQSYVSAVRDAASTLTRPGTWTQTSGASSDATAVGVTTGTNSTPGAYSVQVQSLAAAQSVATSRVFTGAGALIGEGSLSFETGRWSGSSFVPAGAGPFAVEITATDTVETARDKINASGAGVVASLVNDSTGTRLMIRSSETGSANGFRISVSDEDGGDSDNAGLSALSYTSPTSTAARLSQSAADAVATINNLEVRSSTNTLSEVVDGLTLKLGKVTTAPVDVTVTQDTAAMKKSIEGFVTAYNQMASFLTAQTKYDDASKTAGSLQGDSSALSIRNQMRSMLSTDSGASTMFKRLSDIGFDVQADGTIKLQASKLDNALANIPETRKLFANVDAGDSSKDGLMTRLRSLADGYLGFDGALTTRSASLQRRIDLNEDQQAKMEERVAQVEKRLRAQYTSLDTRMGQLSGLSSYVTQQIAALNRSS